MALYIGRDHLVAAREKLENLTRNDLKGLEAEIKVGDLLSEYLPADTYLIAHPIIGNYEPDFLVISPRYGFRIVEVKNWSPSAIKWIYSNGAILIGDKLTHPLIQVQLQLDDLKGYLLSNFTEFKDPYPLLGGVVIHFGLNKKEVNSLISWKLKQENSFFKNNLFKDQLDVDIDLLLGKARKHTYPNNRLLNDDLLLRIVNTIKVSENIVSDAETELNKKRIEEKMITRQNKIIIGLLIVLLALVGSYVFKNHFETTVNSSTVTSFDKLGSIGDDIKFNGEVVSFTYDKKTKTKFLKVTDGTNQIRAVIFKEVQNVPYLMEGSSYLFYGEIQEYQGEKEIKITRVTNQ